MDEQKNEAIVSVDMGGVIAAAAAAGMSASVSISLFPRDEPDADAQEREIRRAIGDALEHGTIRGAKILEPPLSDEDMDRVSANLAQGIASGRLEGDELRTILEHGPGVGRLLCRGLAKMPGFATGGELVHFGYLRQWGSEMLLTPPVVVKALLLGMFDDPGNGWSSTSCPGRPSDDAAAAPDLAAQIDDLIAKQKHVHFMLNLLGAPASLTEPAVTDFGYRGLGQIRARMCEELTVIDSALSHRLTELKAEYGL